MWFYIFTVMFTVVLGGAFTALLDAEEPVQYAISLAGAQLSPLCGLLLACLCSKDFAAFKEIKWKIDADRKFIWILCSILIPILIIGGSALILSVMGKPYVSSSFNTAILLLIVTVVSIIGSIGEEIGWRGFMFPAFNERHSLLSSSIFTGLLWGAWHFGKISLFGIMGYLLFVVLVTEWAVLMAWIFYNTGKSISLMVIFHLTINISSLLVLNEREGLTFYTTGCVLGGILCLIVIMANKNKFLNKS